VDIVGNWGRSSYLGTYLPYLLFLSSACKQRHFASDLTFEQKLGVIARLSAFICDTPPALFLMDVETIINAMTEWKQDEWHPAFSIEQLYANLLSLMKADGGSTGRRLVVSFRRLTETPGGLRMMEDLRNLDEQWGCPLQSAGIAFERLRRERADVEKEQR
jgi:hypothetical protein